MKRGAWLGGLALSAVTALSVAISTADAANGRVVKDAWWNSGFVRAPGRWLCERIAGSSSEALGQPVSVASWQVLTGGMIAAAVLGCLASLALHLGPQIWRRCRGGDWRALKSCLVGLALLAAVTLPLRMLSLMHLAYRAVWEPWLQRQNDVEFPGMARWLLKFAPAGSGHYSAAFLVAVGAALRTRPGLRLSHAWGMAIGAWLLHFVVVECVGSVAMLVLPMGHLIPLPMSPALKGMLFAANTAGLIWVGRGILAIRGRSPLSKDDPFH